MGVSRGIWFAGEATAPFAAVGTVTGAYWSGEAVGRRILDMCGLAGQEEVKEETEEPFFAANTILRGIKGEAGAAERLAHATRNWKILLINAIWLRPLTIMTSSIRGECSLILAPVPDMPSIQ